jgi:hypothetical protein
MSGAFRLVMLGSAAREDVGLAVGLQAIGNSERLLDRVWECLGMVAGRGEWGGELEQG